MEKLVLRYSWGDESASGTCDIPFEYQSREQFIFDVLEKYKEYKWEYYGNSKSDYDTNKVEILGCDFSKGELDQIEHNVLTLESWFDKNKTKIIL